jgi:hypothetical protein
LRREASAFEEQLARARRIYSRFERLNEGIAHDRESDEYIDDIYAFFQACYHVKDHLINDPAYTKHSKEQIEDYVTSTRALAICADICNGSKHLALKMPRSGAEPEIGKKTFHVELGAQLGFGGEAPQEKPPTISIQVDVDHNGQTLDAFQIASDAMNAWEQFVR